jgi:hypothetical protein
LNAFRHILRCTIVLVRMEIFQPDFVNPVKLAFFATFAFQLCSIC